MNAHFFIPIRAILSTGLLLVSQFMIAQPDVVIDSLENMLMSTQADTAKVECLNALSKEYKKISDYEMSMHYAQSALALAKTVNDKKGIASCHINIGNLYGHMGNDPEAFENFLTALEISEEIGYKEGIANAYHNHEKDGCTVAMQWENLSVPFKVKVDVENIVLARIREEFTGVKGFLRSNRFMAAYYCFENDINMEEALSWAEKAITGKPFGENTFVAYETLVTGYEKLGRMAQADSALLEGLSIADFSSFESHSARLITEGRPESAIHVMLLAEKRFGSSFAINDGLAQAYSASGQYKKALSYARQALDQASGEDHRTRLREDIRKFKAMKK